MSSSATLVLKTSKRTSAGRPPVHVVPATGPHLCDGLLQPRLLKRGAVLDAMEESPAHVGAGSLAAQPLQLATHFRDALERESDRASAGHLQDARLDPVAHRALADRQPRRCERYGNGAGGGENGG